MTRVKRGTIKNKRRKNVLTAAKGYRFGRSKKEAMAREALYHAGNHAFNDRRKKKANFRGLWNVQINAGVRAEGLSYSKLIDGLKKKNIALNRKMLAQLAGTYPEMFKQVVAKVK